MKRYAGAILAGTSALHSIYMKILCAWCKGTIKDSVGNVASVSHGICAECRLKNFPETLRTVQENAQTIMLAARKGREGK